MTRIDSVMLFLKIGIEDQDTFLLSSRGVDRHEPSEVPVLIKHNEPKKTMNSILNRCHSFNLIFGLLLLSNVAFGQAPVFTNAKVAGGTFSVQVLIASNQLYTIQVSTNLTSWNSVGSDTATNSLITLVDPRGTAGFSHQYYRIMLGAVASFSLQFLEFANAGSFNSNSTPNTTFPVSLNSYSAALQVNDDANYPSATNVFFTGPAGSGLTNAAGDPNNSSMNDNSAFYQSPIVTSPTTAPAGNWVVNYKGSNQTFTVSNPATHLVVPYPTLTVSGGALQSVSWVYRDATTGATLGGAPAYVSNIQLQVNGNSSQSSLYNSPNLTPATTSHTLTTPVTYSSISGIALAYQDTLGNNYVVMFGP